MKMGWVGVDYIIMAAELKVRCGVEWVNTPGKGKNEGDNNRTRGKICEANVMEEATEYH